MIKIDIISGFLGAGKTTFLKKIVGEALQNCKIVMIENEFGEIGIDGDFLQASGIEVKEINSGCICCSLVGDFAASLQEVIEQFQPERILIEPSGVGKLSDVIKAVEDIGMKVNSTVTIVDAIKYKIYSKNFGEFYLNQVTHANTIVLSRTDNMTVEKIEKCLQLLKSHNPSATIITTPWEQLQGKVILDVMENQEKLENKLLKETQVSMTKKNSNHEEEHAHECNCKHEEEHGHECNCDHKEEHAHDCNCGQHHAEEVFVSWGRETVSLYAEEEIKHCLEHLEDDEKYGFVLRCKGMLPKEDGSWIYFDYTPGEIEIRRGNPHFIGKICVIGSNLKELNLEKLFIK